MKYKIGQKVRGKNFTTRWEIWNGGIGTIIYADNLRLGIEWEKECVWGHSCGYRGKGDHCRWFYKSSHGKNESIKNNLSFFSISDLIGLIE